MENRLDRDDWLRAARLALLHRGASGVRVEVLAQELRVTKGSFYWHFRDRDELLEALLQEWERETDVLERAIGDPTERGLDAFFAELRRRTIASERGDASSDVAILAWAATDPSVAHRVNASERERMRLTRKLAGNAQLGDLLYYAFQGFLLRRRRVPAAAADFSMLEKMARALIRRVRVKKSRFARTAATGMVLLLAAASDGCTTYRIVRWREPSPHVQPRAFPERIVRRADVPFVFVRAPQRSDLDTVSVRDVDGRLRPFAEYVRLRSIRSFVVIRNDTILYERYAPPRYTDSTRASTFSVSKSVTSAILGRAIADGALSLDDPVTTHVPAIRGRGDFAGVTLGQLLGMRSGFAYTRTNGNWWHDLRSSDAHFYHTTDLRESLRSMKRATLPGAAWAYKDSDTELLAWALASATGKNVAALTREIWARIGAEFDASWSLDHGGEGGMEKTASGFNAAPRDLARFARLYLHDGSWNGDRLLPVEWVRASTALDRTRSEPEVPTWWRMQHQRYWWIPMHNWDAERDFFADGSKGQRVYVHRPTKTIIVQVADDSRQDFPFRKIAHYLAGQSYRYPQGIPGAVLRAARQFGADSARLTFERLTAEERQRPERWFNNRAEMNAVIALLESERPAAAVELRRVVESYYR
jgi:CubicO group peptidase (beta-lactamase class C family)